MHYCNTVPLQMQNALNTIKLQKRKKRPPSVHTAQEKRKKEMSYQIVPSPLEYSMSQTWVVPVLARSLPLRKSSNIYIFNPIKNEKERKKRIECTLPHSKHYQQSSSVLCSCDLHPSKIFIFLQAAFAASYYRKENEQSQNGNTKSVAYNLQTWTLSPVESEIAGIQTNKL